MLRQSQTLENSDGQVKLIHDRINLVETHFANICSACGSYCRKTAHVRDKGDNLAKVLQDYASAETLNRSLRNGLGKFANCLTAVEDYRQAMIDRLDVKVVGNLSPYSLTCKMAKDNVKKALQARNRQLERRRQLQKAQSRAPMNRQEIAESELTKATVDASQSLQQLEQLSDSFEQNKLQDIKKVLLDFVNVELLFHAKALEIYTTAFNCLKSIDEEEDLQEFRDCLKLAPSGTSRLDLVKSIAERSPYPSPSHKLGDTSTNSMQSLVGQLQVLRYQKTSVDSKHSSDEDDDDYDDNGRSLEQPGRSIEVQSINSDDEPTPPLPRRSIINSHKNL